jgi:Zn-dependent M28 family amino/carboxypeptidase
MLRSAGVGSQVAVDLNGISQTVSGGTIVAEQGGIGFAVGNREDVGAAGIQGRDGDLAAILNLDMVNLYGRTADVSALGLDQSTLGKAFTAAAAAEGMKVTTNEEALIRGFYFRSDHFPLARVGVPGTSLENGNVYIGRPPGYGKEQRAKYDAERYHQPQDEILPWFTYDGAIQQLRVTVRTAVAVGDAPKQPEWVAGSEFREAGLARRKTAGS